MEPVVVAGPRGYGFAEELTARLSAELVVLEEKSFPDGESYARLGGSVAGRIVVAVYPLYPRQDTGLVRLLEAVEASRGAGALRVVAFPPYMAYSRQDRRFLPGEPVTARIVLRSLGAAGADAFATIDVHKERVLEEFPGPVLNIDPAPALAPLLRGYSDVVVVGPDRGALGRARRLAELLNAPYDYLEKTRDRVTGEVAYRPKTVSVEGRTVVLVDDIISTGGTIAKAAEMLYRQGARRVVAACSHGLFVGNALEKLRAAGVREVYALNHLPLPEGVQGVPSAPAAAEQLRGLLERLGEL